MIWAKGIQKGSGLMQSLFEENLIKGWRGIATHIGRSVSTAKRYRKHYSMPVRCFPSGRPYAFVFELDKYLLYVDDYISGRRKLKSAHAGKHKRNNG